MAVVNVLGAQRLLAEGRRVAPWSPRVSMVSLEWWRILSWGTAGLRSGVMLGLTLVLVMVLGVTPARAQLQPVIPSSALSFDGVDDYVVMSVPTALQSPGSNDFSVMAWVRLDASSNIQRIFFSQTNAANFVSLLRSNSNQLYAYVYANGSSHSVASAQPIAAVGTWVHVAVVWQSATSTAAIFLNGVQAQVISGGASSVGTDGVMTLGARTDGAQPFSGTLSKMAIYSSALTATQVGIAATQCIYPQGATNTYNFDQGVPGGNNAGTTMLSDTTGGLNGNLVNFALTGAHSNWVAADSSPLCQQPTYSVGGNVSGLASGESLVLQNNGGDNQPVSANGAFTFPTQVSNGNAYAVTVLTQPTDQTCTVSQGSGTMGASNVSNVAVSCVSGTHSVGGNVSGLATGKSMVLQNNGGDNLTVSANGVFTFATQVTNGNAYAVTVLTQPTDQTCTISQGSGTMGASSVSDVAVNCISGLAITTTGFGSLQKGQTLSGLQLSASGGSGSYAWSAADAAQPLPAGLNLSVSGLLTGTPTAEGNYSTLVTVADGGGASQQMLISTKAAGTVSQVFTGTVAAATPAAATPVPLLGALGIVMLNLVAAALGALGLRWRRTPSQT